MSLPMSPPLSLPLSLKALQAPLPACMAMLLGAAASSPALAIDAHAIALGGSSIAYPSGPQGALANPASLMQLQRTGKVWHLYTGAAADVRDPGELIRTAMDVNDEDLINQLDAEVERLSGTSITCTDQLPTAGGTQPCLTGTEAIGALANRALEIMDAVDGNRLEGRGGGGFGLAMTGNTIPVAINGRVSVTAIGGLAVAPEDRNYVNDLAVALEDGTLTDGEIVASIAIGVDTASQSLQVDRPEEVLVSRGDGAVLLRSQLGIGLAMTHTVKGMNIDLGATPRFSRLRASSLDETLATSFDDAVESSASDRLEDNEVTESSFTVDLGAAMDIPDTPLRAAAVLRNAIAEEITTGNGFVFKTTAQLVIGGAWSINPNLTGTADLALNQAKVDNFETQPIALGLEYASGIYALRGGISHDAARTDEATALSAGFGIGPVEIGARLADFDRSAQLAAQVSFSF